MKVKLWTEKKLMKGAEPYFLPGKKRLGVLLFHGWTSTPQEIRSTAEALNKLGYPVYAPLLLGHGTEPKDMIGFTWEDWLVQAQDFYDEFAGEVDGIVIGGMSMGANIALNLAARNPVKAIIAMGTPLFFVFEPIFVLISKLRRHKTGLIRKIYSPRDYKVAKKKVHYADYAPQSMYEAVRSGLETRKVVKGIKAPILVIHSNTDHVTTMKSVRYILAEASSKVKQKIIVKDCYHVFTVDKCAWQVNKQISDFIEEFTRK